MHSQQPSNSSQRYQPYQKTRPQPHGAPSGGAAHSYGNFVASSSRAGTSTVASSHHPQRPNSDLPANGVPMLIPPPNLSQPPPALPAEHRVNENRPSAEEQAEMDSLRVSSKLLEYVDKFKFPYINDVSNYERLSKIGQGTFGEVFKARCRKTMRMVALKKILMENEKEGFPITALREVKMLQALKHENITELIEVCSSKASVHNRDRSTFFLVFTFCEHDLAGLLSNVKIKLSPVHKKTLMKHMMEGLYKIHKSKILHRDMKAANVLITRDGVLKLADFGLARTFLQANPPQLYTNRVVTLWYRPPELLLGDRKYSTSIDMWGAGCIMAELYTRNPIMQGDTEQKQLVYISNLCGPINKDVWENVESLPLYGKVNLPQNTKRTVHLVLEKFINREPLALQMIEELLTLDPSKRLSAIRSVEHSYFFTEPTAAENVKDLMDTIKTSQFEYTVGRGAHANRGRMQQGPARPVIPPAKAQMQSGQFHDMVF